MQLANGFDAPSRKGGRSSAASRRTFHAKVAPNLAQREMDVYERVLFAGAQGITPKEMAAQMKVDHNVISGRFKALRDTYQVIRKRGDRRGDSAVYVPVFADASGQMELLQEAV